MEQRQLGYSGLKVPVLSFGAATFGGVGDFKSFGEVQEKEARRMVDLCLEYGVTLFDTADMYSDGVSEEILGSALKGRRDKVLIATKAAFRMGTGPNDEGCSRYHLIRACEESLKRLGTDYIDLYQMHSFDAHTPIEETLSALDNLVRSGKVRYIGCSNFSGWQVMKSLAISEKFGLARYIAYQGYYSLVGRDYEGELMPLALDQNIGLLVWSPLGSGRLTGKVGRGKPLPPVSRLHTAADVCPVPSDEYVYRVIDVLEEIGRETGKAVSQVALNWLLQRPTVSSVIIGARNEEQLKQNLGAIGWKLTAGQMARLDTVSSCPQAYPYWHQAFCRELIPSPLARHKGGHHEDLLGSHLQ